MQNNRKQIIFQYFFNFIFSFYRGYKTAAFRQNAKKIKINYDYYEQNNREQGGKYRTMETN